MKRLALSLALLGIAFMVPTPVGANGCPAEVPAGDTGRYRAAVDLEDPAGIQACAASADTSILQGIAKNSRTSPETLRALSKHGHKHVRGAVAKNPNTPEDTLRALALDPEVWVRVETATNPALPIDVLAAFVALAEQSVNNPRNEAYVYLAQGVALNPSAPQDTLRRLAQHPMLTVRQNVAMNSSAPDDLLRMLAQDREQMVRNQANSNLARRGGAAPAPSAGAAPPAAVPPAVVPSVIPPATAAQFHPTLLPAWQALLGLQARTPSGDTVGGLFHWIAEGSKVRVTTGSIPGGWGSYRARDNTITISDRAIGEDPRVVAAVLAHELWHVWQVANGFGTALDCVGMEAQAHMTGANVWFLFWNGLGPERTQLEREMNQQVRILTTEGEGGFYKYVVDNPGYIQQCDLWTP